VLQKVSDPLLTVCPACGAAAFRKQVTAAGFQLKGSGWYVTDFRGGDGKKAVARDGASDGAAKGDAAQTEAKPAEAGSGKADAAPAPAPASTTTSADKPAATPPPAAAGGSAS
jgi:predicted nucleic acid-binding Zn ribbon protein